MRTAFFLGTIFIAAEINKGFNNAKYSEGIINFIVIIILIFMTMDLVDFVMKHFIKKGEKKCS